MQRSSRPAQAMRTPSEAQHRVGGGACQSFDGQPGIDDNNRFGFPGPTGCRICHKRMSLKAVLFDFDGVLAETENHHVTAWQRTLAALGWQVPDEMAAHQAEVDDREFLVDLFTLRGVPIDRVNDWIRRKQDLTVGAAAVLPASLSGRNRPGPATPSKVHWRSSPAPGARISRPYSRPRVCPMLFETIVAKEDVTAQKPAPDGLSTGVEAAPPLAQVGDRAGRLGHWGDVGPRRGPPGSSRWAIAAPTASGWATRPTSRASSRPRGCSST